MSCYEWEAGTWKLSFDQFRQSSAYIRRQATGKRDTVWNASQAFWAEIPNKAKRSPMIYKTLVRRYIHGDQCLVHHWNVQPEQIEAMALAPAHWNKGPCWEGADQEMSLGKQLEHLLEWTAFHTFVKGDPDSEDLRLRTSRSVTRDRPRRIITRDLPKITSSTRTFECGPGSDLAFSQVRTVHWSVESNNHARDRGRGHPLAKAWFQHLEKIKWTRGTGGEVWGNDEYNGDSSGVGGGGNYSLGTWGNKR